MDVQETIDRSKRPAPDPAPAFAFPPYQRFTLDNGLKVFLVRDERPLITFRMLFRGGSGLDGDVTGLADAVADQLVKGTTTMSAQEFARRIDFVGGSINPSASQDALSITASGLRRHLGTILELFAGAVRNPAFSDEELEKYRQDQLTSLKAAKAQPEFLASHAVSRVLYGETPYGAMPTEAVLTSLTPELLRAYHDAYVVPSNGSLAVVGNFTEEELRGLLEGAFGDWKIGPAPTVEPPVFPERRGRRVILVDRPAAVQSSVRVVSSGPRSNNPDRPKCYILNSILGAGTGLGNRLAMNLRETNAFTYTPYSYFDANLYAGSFVAVADVGNEVTSAAVREMLHEIRRMSSEPVPADELERNIQSAVGNFLLSISDPSTTAMRVQSIDFYGLPEDYYSRLVDAYSTTTTDEVARLAGHYLNEENLAIVVVGKSSAIAKELEEFGTVEIWDTELRPVEEATEGVYALSESELWARLLEALGGGERLRAVTSMRTVGTVTVSMGGQSMTGAIERIEALPNLHYQVVNVGGMKQESFVNEHQVAQTQMGDTQHLEGEALACELEGSHFLPAAYLEETGASTRAIGRRMVNGAETVAVELLYPMGRSFTYYLDPETFLPRAQEEPEKGVTYLSDWRSIDGVMLPHAITLEPQPGLSFVVTDIQYQLDVPVDPKRFMAPA